MKFAFSTVSCPAWDFETIVARAREYGYDGVEIRGFLNESVLTAANPFLTDAAKLRKTFETAGVEICCRRVLVRRLWQRSRARGRDLLPQRSTDPVRRWGEMRQPRRTRPR